MAFGKNPQNRSTAGSFRQLSNQAAQRQGGRRKSSGVPYFVDMFAPPEGMMCQIRLMAGDYAQDQIEGEGDAAEVVSVVMPFITFTDHFDGGKQRGAICSAGPFANDKKRRDPCHGCDIYWATAGRNSNGKWESSRMSKQKKYVFSVFDYSKYHKVPQMDRHTGQVRLNDKGEAYTNWVRCDGQGCDGCRSQAETKTGKASHWPMTYTQLQVLRTQDKNIGKSCTTCGTLGGQMNSPDPIASLAWVCGTEGCGELVVDMQTTQLKQAELDKITDEPHYCQACGEKNFLVEIFECSVCAPRGQEGNRATLWDVDLTVMLVAGGANGAKNLQIGGWSAPYPLNPAFEEAKPLDLVERYKPASLEVQADLFGVVPTTGQGARQPVTGAHAGAPGAPANPPARQYQNPFPGRQQ